MPADYVARIEEILVLLDTVTRPGEMDKSGYRLHTLSGNLSGFWSVAVSGNWRIIFRFDGGNVTDVDFVDYH